MNKVIPAPVEGNSITLPVRISPFTFQQAPRKAKEKRNTTYLVRETPTLPQRIQPKAEKKVEASCSGVQQTPRKTKQKKNNTYLVRETPTFPQWIQPEAEKRR